jgi:hypothetical protein
MSIGFGEWRRIEDEPRRHATKPNVYWTVVGVMVGSLLFQMTAPQTWVDDVAARVLAAVGAAGLGACAGLLVGRLTRNPARDRTDSDQAAD